MVGSSRNYAPHTFPHKALIGSPHLEGTSEDPLLCHRPEDRATRCEPDPFNALPSHTVHASHASRNRALAPGMMKVMKTMCCCPWEHNDKASRRNYKKLCTQSRNAKEDASPANRSARRVCSRPLLLLRLLLVLLPLRRRLRAHRPCDDPPSPRRARDEPTSASEGLGIK